MTAFVKILKGQKVCKKKLADLSGNILTGAGGNRIAANSGDYLVAPNLLSLGAGIAFCIGGGFFLSMLLNRHQENWWAAFPGVILFTLGLTIGMSTLFPRLADVIAGRFSWRLGLSFWLVFLITPDNWWAYHSRWRHANTVTDRFPLRFQTTSD